MYTRSSLRLLAALTILGLLSPAVLAQQPPALPTMLEKPPIVYKVSSPSDRLDMTVHTSRILTTEQKIAQAQADNPEILDLTALSPNQVQIAAKAAGITQVNLWDENKKLYTINVIVYRDVQELTMVLRSAFPRAALKVVPVANAVMISGYVEQPEQIDRIIRVAEEFYPKVINNMTVGGCQQVMLHVKIMEVSRTKLREFGFDWASIMGSNMVTSGASGMVSPPYTPVLPAGVGSSIPPASPSANTPINSTAAFNIASGNNAFFGVLNALRDDGLAKVLAEPTLTTVTGGSASFRAGGSFYIIPNGQNGGPPLTVTYGTKLDFVPIVLGNGRIHLEVRSIISDIDPSLPSEYQPALKDRTAETRAELQAGQTLAIAGLVQTRIEAQNKGLPWLSELPYVGRAFGMVKETRNEIELLIMVTPEFVEAIDACDVPPCGPGMQTTSPSDWELFMKGHLEVPNCCPGGGPPCGDCSTKGGNPNGPPPDGMIGPSEAVPVPQPGAATKPRNPQIRYSSSKAKAPTAASPSGPQDGPPGLIGPVGYDVVK
jgi:pilus assembly protein CpaC